MKLQMKREALEKLNRQANEMVPETGIVMVQRRRSGTVLVQSESKMRDWSSGQLGKCFRIRVDSTVGV
jgi:hypothetical protein